ncbi:MAG: NADH-quinone oxidoreductase subunit L [Candidatus Omnitrophica bacterium]|nr:NADH-quinone oxidoreductase subunit L [Candidatus Omnitrophota bacterium]
MAVESCCTWLLLLSPLLAFAGIALVGVHRRRLSAGLAIGGLLVAFLCASWLFIQTLQGRFQLPIEVSVNWIALPDFTVPFGVLIDRLSLLMSLVVTGVGSAIFFYSTGYMAEDAGYPRYFGMLSLFAFSMLTIVLANNWVELFIGWELVGFCSYALIGHWYQRPQAAEAGKKAFLVNRVADFGFMLGILMLWVQSSPVVFQRTVHYHLLEGRLAQLIHAGWLSPEMLSITGLLIFCGVLGKSAQMPLHVWLPDAMEGPTPVSALIHAATMVAAGVYLLCRTFWLFADLPSVLHVIAWVGGTTAFLAAWLAVVEPDLKRILAYSTLSQLGYMVMALGLGGPTAGMYHLTTHAFFKALLFLAAGSVIHGTHRQNIWELGGLWRSMRWTSLAFLIGGLALCGFPALSGFFSKDEILVLAHEHSQILYWLGTFTAGLTAFYIARAWFVAFLGKPAEHLHPHESPLVMLGPLALLSVLSVVGGYLGIPAFLGQTEGRFHWDVAGASLAVIALGLALAWAVYAGRLISASDVARRFSAVQHILARRYYVDDLYDWYVTQVQQQLLAGGCAVFERFVIIGFGVNGIAWLTRSAGRIIRRCQTGQVQSYALAFFSGVVVLLYVVNRF